MNGLDLEGRSVLVTGASRGLGRSIAVAFGEAGARVGVAFRTRAEEAERTAAAVREAGGLAETLPLDVRDSHAVDETVRQFAGSDGLDVLVNSAAEVRDHPFVTLSPKEWDSVVGTNLGGTYRCCRAAAPGMMARGRGAIVNVASVAGLRASPGQANYAASKAGVAGLTRTLAAELASYGVRVNAVAPGFLDTGMGARLDRRVAERRRATIPAGRFGAGEEVAAAVLFLASDASSYIVGQVLAVDGGLSL